MVCYERNLQIQFNNGTRSERIEKGPAIEPFWIFEEFGGDVTLLIEIRFGKGLSPGSLMSGIYQSFCCLYNKD
jgi:hypothetical protein